MRNLVNPDVESASPQARGLVKKSFDFDQSTEEQINTKIVLTCLTMADDIHDRAMDNPKRNSWLCEKIADR